MTDSGQTPGNRPLRAPRGDRTALVEPPFGAVGDLLAENLRRRGAYRCDVLGRSLAELTAEARDELLSAAREYTAGYRDLPTRRVAGPLLLAGHQPELFHPGVWFKNFALAGLAERHGGTAVNLVIDNDTLKTASLRVPGGSIRQPTARAVEYDAAAEEIPYEQREIRDRRAFDSFGRRAAAEIAPLVADPLVKQLWPLAVERAGATGLVGLSLAQARHRFEGQMGLATLELPQSRVCGLAAFQWFAVHLLAHLPRFRDVYNRAVAEYRRRHRIRSANHPVPELAAEDDWLEAPFWIWRDDDSRRRRTFARRTAGELLLTDRGRVTVRLPLADDGDGRRAAEALAQLPARGVKLRTRALSTTLFARLVLGDLFLHGIGGAKYDQLTDALMAGFYGVAPPEFMVLSATLLLPIPRARAGVDDLCGVERTLRELTFHPERHIEGVGGAADEVARLVGEKRGWIERDVARAEKRARSQAIRAVNAALQPWVRPRRERIEAERADLVERLKAEAILASREASFCLYPEKSLRDFYLEMSPARA